jgi:hypothetical protein
MTTIRAFNVVATMVAFGINVATAASLLNVYALGRRREQLLYVALGCLLVLPSYLWDIGWLDVLGSAQAFVALVGVILSASLIPYAWSYGEWGSSRARWTITAITIAGGALTIGRPPRDTIVVMMPGVTLICLRLSFNAFRSALKKNREARAHSISWLFIFAALPWDLLAQARGMSPHTTPRFAAIASSVFIISNLLTLGRQLVETVDRAETLNIDLQAKLVLVERSAEEITSLNVELRRQVAERSRDLADALGRGLAHARHGSISVGELFENRYRIVRLIGRGGMGAVYEATRTSDDRHVALKVLAGDPTPAAASRFAREAEIAATVNDPHVVSILDVGVARSGLVFLVMELVDGPSMEHERPRFGDAAWALPILGQLAEGLAALHGRNVIHRDLKPANVLLAQGLNVKIADFGISRFDESEVDPQAHTISAPRIGSARLTETGAWIGTPLYMPPESVHGGLVRSSADIFAFGVIAYEMLTGQTPFPVPPIYDALAGRSLSVPALVRSVDPSLARLLRDCVAENPAVRPTIEVLRVAFDDQGSLARQCS